MSRCKVCMRLVAGHRANEPVSGGATTSFRSTHGYQRPHEWQHLTSVATSDILVLKLISVLVFILFSSQNFYFI